MGQSLEKMIQGLRQFRKQYAEGEQPLMHQLATKGQQPQIMIVACADSRVDPAIALQCSPGDLFVTRNVANIIPPYEADDHHHGTSAALEFGICYLKVKHLIILGHSNCGGMHARLNQHTLSQDDFLSKWLSLIDTCSHTDDPDEAAKEALSGSVRNCFEYPWIKQRVENGELTIHRWFFDIANGEILSYSDKSNQFEPILSDTSPA